MNETDNQATPLPTSQPAEGSTPVPLPETTMPPTGTDNASPDDAAVFAPAALAESDSAADIMPEATAAPDVTSDVTAAPDVTSDVTAAPDVTPEATAAPDATSDVTAAPDATPEATAAPDATPDVTVAPDASPEVTATAALPTASPASVPDPHLSFLWIAVPVLLLVLAAAAVLLLRQRKPDARQPERAPTENRAAPKPASPKPASPKPASPKPILKSETIKQTERMLSSDAEKEKEKQQTMRPSHHPFGYAQTVGMRPNQEDCYGVSTSDAFIQEFGILAVVADGIGGMADGQVASKAVVHSMFELLGQLPATDPAADRLLKLAAAAQSSVLDVNRRAQARCGSTLVSVLIDNDHLTFLSIGDSRIYLLRSGALLQLNREHEVGPGHDENVALGYTAETLDARRRAALTSYVGKENLTQIDRNTQPLRLLHGDRILLMTDGVFGTLSDSEMTACLSGPAQQAADQVIAAVSAKRKPHQDNATLVIVDYP